MNTITILGHKFTVVTAHNEARLREDVRNREHYPDDTLPRTAQLFAEAYSHGHIGADDLTRIMTGCEMGKPLSRSQVQQALYHLNVAVCKLRSLESLLAGNPEPATGD